MGILNLCQNGARVAPTQLWSVSFIIVLVIVIIIIIITILVVIIVIINNVAATFYAVFSGQI